MKLTIFYTVQGFSITKILLDNGGSCPSSSYLSHWVEFVEIYSQVTLSIMKLSSRNDNFIFSIKLVPFSFIFPPSLYALNTSLYNLDAKALDNCVFLTCFQYLVLYVFSGCSIE